MIKGSMIASNNPYAMTRNATGIEITPTTTPSTTLSVRQ